MHQTYCFQSGSSYSSNKSVTSSGATLSFTVRSKGDGGQPCCLIMQKVAVHFRIPCPCCPKNTVNTVVFATNGKNSKTLCIPLFLACEAPKTSIFTVLFVPKPSKKLAKHSQTDAFWGRARITAIINNNNDSKHLSLDFLVSCFLGDVGVVTHFTQIRFYKRTALRTAALTQSAHALTQRGLCTGKLLHTDAFTHRGFHAKNFLHTEAFTHRCFTQRCFCTAQHLRTDELHAHRRFYIQMLSRRSFYTEIPLHRAVFTQRSFSRLQKKANRYLNLDLFRFLSFPFQIVTANG